MQPRRYRVYFEIDENASLRWTGGVKPTTATLEEVQSMYATGRHGSNGGPA